MPRWVDTGRRPDAPTGPGTRERAQRIAWLPPLGRIVAALGRLSEAELEFLERANCFLRDGGAERPVVPGQERSLELFGDEKRLDAFVRGRLFADGELRRLLRFRPAPPPFVWRRVGEGPVMLVAENSATFSSLSQLLADTPSAVATVAYGAGNAFVGSVASALELDQVPERILYFGDLDRVGLHVPAVASRVARELGLPAVEPAAGLYRRLLAWGIERDADREVPESAARELALWLPAPLREEAIALLAGGRWLPQEAVGLERLAIDLRWFGEFSSTSGHDLT